MKILRATEQLGQEVYSLDELYPMSDITDGLDISMLDKSLSNGMIFPLIVYPVIVSQWRTEATHNELYIPPPKHLNDSDVILQIKCGCNRYTYAKTHGYTHIEAVKTDKGEVVNKHIKEFEKWWQGVDNGMVL